MKLWINNIFLETFLQKILNIWIYKTKFGEVIYQTLDDGGDRKNV
jgi:hypothetical protein